MLYYRWYDWLFFFFFYSFIGWIWESCYVSVQKKRWENRGFLNVPLIPLYGSGAVVMLVITIPFRNSLIAQFVVGAVGATLLELITGMIMEWLFKVRYWDYSNQKFHYRSYICLGATLLWGAFTVVLTQVVHPPVETLVTRYIPDGIRIVAVIITGIIFVLDAVYSFRAAFNMRRVLEAMTKIRSDLEAVQEQLAQLSMEAVGLVTESGTAALKKVEDLKTRMEELAGRQEELLDNFFKNHRKILRELPYTTSRAFGKALEDLKNRYKINYLGIFPAKGDPAAETKETEMEKNKEEVS